MTRAPTLSLSLPLALRLRKLTPHLLRVRGGRRVVEWLERRSAHLGDVCIEDFLGQLQFWCRLDEHMSSHIFWRGSYSTELWRYLQGRALPDDVFVDVGANHGEVSLMAAALMPGGRVYAFEPVTENFQRLQRNVDANGLSYVQCFQLGLSDEPGELPLYTQAERREDGTWNKGLPSLYASDQRPQWLECVKLERLDDFVAQQGLTRLNYLKIDVEGAELAVLNGAKQTLATLRPTLLIEFNAETCAAAGYPLLQLATSLTALGYSLAQLGADGRTYPLDLTKLPPFANVVARPQA